MGRSNDLETKYAYGVEWDTASLLGLLDESYIDTYKEFLQQRKALKRQVELDFNTWENNQNAVSK